MCGIQRERVISYGSCHVAWQVCLAGAGIHSVLLKAAALGVDSHSVLGSIFLNPTTAAGIAFGSGVRPTYLARCGHEQRSCCTRAHAVRRRGTVTGSHGSFVRSHAQGTQLRKGPVYTERLLYAHVDDKGKVCRAVASHSERAWPDL